MASSWSQHTEILLHTLRTAPLTLPTESLAPPVPDGEAPPVGPATPLALAWLIGPISWAVVMAQLMLEDGDGGVCVSTTKVVGVPDTSETSDGIIAVGRGVVASGVWLAVVACSAVVCSAVVTLLLLLSLVTVISWPGAIESMSWARATEPASASTRNRDAMVDEDGSVECSKKRVLRARVGQVSSAVAVVRSGRLQQDMSGPAVAQRPFLTVEDDGLLPVA
ncbi:hypothetical protein F5883DRAFT_9863 [Diaporthe sp. PMI_573]|nr:hypothetical protein F5883DRAFT_9863 [Diaporthaceae sp. PMI_573]